MYHPQPRRLLRLPRLIRSHRSTLSSLTRRHHQIQERLQREPLIYNAVLQSQDLVARLKAFSHAEEIPFMLEGFASETERQKKKHAWGAVLGTFVAIAVVGLVAYVILKRKHHKDFSHRKLEEFPSDPVLRLDNSEPLDLNFGRAAYYNPALQSDNIQMSPYPKA
ncbi:hypothetical protein WMY93_013194 [Mugilogobius chulae]|uniref:Uncharacterized protein n=1 Tax=Mugilogobius chulae TaxID=88201 RepID=A0AAW0P0Y1_9GOBI